jgi:hypothetical protein
MPGVNRQSRKGPAGGTNPVYGVRQPAEPANAWDLAGGIRMLLYGASGTGKTTLWSTFPDPILTLVCSGGNRPGELKSIDTPENRERISPKVIASTRQLTTLMEEAYSGKYATLVLDHASGLADLMIMEMLGLDAPPISKYRAAGKGESWSLISQQQYGQLAVQCKDLFRDMLNLPCNVVIVAQERVFGGKDEGNAATDPELLKPTVGAALTPSIVGWLNPACDYVVQTFKRPRFKQVVRNVGGKQRYFTERDKGVEYCLRCEPHETFITKFRVPRGTALPDVIVNPTYDKIQAVIEGRYDPAAA